jgi:regulator of protease activity HflC (stomatin/prohibitin superfamily)
MGTDPLYPLSGGFEILGILLIMLAVAALWSTVKIVPQGKNYTVENFGRYTRTPTPKGRVVTSALYDPVE